MFSCYDVGGRSSLSMNELFLLLKSTTTGLCKLSGIDAPDSARLESIASLVRKSGAISASVVVFFVVPLCRTGLVSLRCVDAFASAAGT